MKAREKRTVIGDLVKMTKMCQQAASSIFQNHTCEDEAMTPRVVPQGGSCLSSFVCREIRRDRK